LGPVPGSGDPKARLVLVGEAPGETEARQGRPFVGAAGRLLDEALAKAGLSRDQVWTTNTVKCRPVLGEGPRYRNRAPTTAEIRLSQALLEAELQLLPPRAIVSLGAPPAKPVIHPKPTTSTPHRQRLRTRYGPKDHAT